MRRATHTRYITRPASTPRSFVTRVMSSEIRRLRYVCSGLSQWEAYAPSPNHWEPDTSAIRMHDFVAESSDETPIERFLVWDPVEDPNVLFARPATVEAIRRNAAAAALNALSGSDEGEGEDEDEGDGTEDERDDREDDVEEETNDDGDDGSDDDDDSNDDDMGGIRVEKK